MRDKRTRRNDVEFENKSKPIELSDKEETQVQRLSDEHCDSDIP